MQLTRITKENERNFLPLFPVSALIASDKLIRLGILNDEGEIAGALSAWIYDGFIDILSLYILPSFRRQGYARALVDTLADIAKRNGYEALTGEFLRDTTSAVFSGACGFELFEDRTQYYFTLGEYLRSPLYKRLVSRKKCRPVPRVSSLSHEDRQVLNRQFDIKYYDPAWSTACIENGVYKSCLLAEHDPYKVNGKEQGNVNILMLDSRSRSPVDFLYHIRALSDKAISEFGDDKDIVFRMIFKNEKIIMSMIRLMGRKTILHSAGRYVYGVRLLS
ncbi:MAG: GNAT family N-acetyltransferase [Lachnospiraceae bacterium]|nr:GNAT family N-acetyltransferase [Lachnospiraceae bacterium]